MFVQALAGYADTHLQKELNDVAFEERAIPYFIEIAPDGRFLSAIPRFIEDALPAGKKGKAAVIRRPMTYRVPRSPVNRNSGLYPLLAADDIKYVLGVGQWTKSAEEANHAERHGAFVALIDRVAEQTGDEALTACSTFYARPAEVAKARAALAEAAPGSNVALSVDGVVIDRESLQVWWRQAYETAAAGRASVEVAECLISGIVGPIPPTHPKIKHTSALGGQAAGVSLMSFDKGAFRSYGWEQCANSPVSADRAMAYVLALNDLLKPRSVHRRDFNGVAFLFWVRKPLDEDADPFTLVVDAKPEQIANLLNLDRPARSLEADPDENLFYMAAVSANGSRLILRSWVTETLPRVKDNVRGWFEGLRVQPWGADRIAAPPPMWQLLQAIDREGKPPEGRVASLIHRALEGPRHPLDRRILQDVLARMKVDPAKRTYLPSLGLLRLSLNDLYLSAGEGEPMPESLDQNDPYINKAFICGRLLAVYENIQFRTYKLAREEQPNANVADRFYSMCMVSPSISFARISELGKKHLAKIRRIEQKRQRVDSEGKGQNLSVVLESRIVRIAAPLNGVFPKGFSVHDKARFALGYYHQKAFRPKRTAEPAAETQPPNLTEKESDL